MTSYPLNHYVWWPSMNLHKGQDYIKLRNLPSLVASSFALPVSPLGKRSIFNPPPTICDKRWSFLRFFTENPWVRVHFLGMLGVRVALTLEVGQHPGATETTCGFTQNHLWRRSPSSLGFLVQNRCVAKNACWMLAGEDEECQWRNLMEKKWYYPIQTI